MALSSLLHLSSSHHALDSLSFRVKFGAPVEQVCKTDIPAPLLVSVSPVLSHEFVHMHISSLEHCLIPVKFWLSLWLLAVCPPFVCGSSQLHALSLIHVRTHHCFFPISNQSCQLINSDENLSIQDIFDCEIFLEKIRFLRFNISISFPARNLKYSCFFHKKSKSLELHLLRFWK